MTRKSRFIQESQRQESQIYSQDFEADGKKDLHQRMPTD